MIIFKKLSHTTWYFYDRSQSQLQRGLPMTHLCTTIPLPCTQTRFKLTSLRILLRCDDHYTSYLLLVLRIILTISLILFPGQGLSFVNVLAMVDSQWHRFWAPQTLHMKLIPGTTVVSTSTVLMHLEFIWIFYIICLIRLFKYKQLILALAAFPVVFSWFVCWHCSAKWWW